MPLFIFCLKWSLSARVIEYAIIFDKIKKGHGSMIEMEIASEVIETSGNQ